MSIRKRIRRLLKKETAKKFFIEALCGFVFWTIFLTPYVLPLVCNWNLAAYVNWLTMQAVFIPFISIIIVNLTNVIVSRFINKKKLRFYVIDRDWWP